MPGDLTVQRARCGLFYFTFLSFMTERAETLRVVYKCVRFVPRRCGFQRAPCVNIFSDCPVFYFQTGVYQYTEHSVMKTNFGPCSATLVIVLLSRLLLLSGDVETNPGPSTPPFTQPYPFGQWGYSPWIIPPHFFSPSGRQSSFPTSTIPSTAQSSPSCPPSLEPVLQPLLSKLDSLQGQISSLTDDMQTMNVWCRALQTENDQLTVDVRYLSEKCYSLDQHVSNLNDWRDHFQRTTSDLDAKIEKQEAFSRRNNARFFDVDERPNESYSISGQKVTRLLNRYFPFKTWVEEDVERAHRVGPRDNNKHRTLIARFRHWADKLAVLSDSEGRYRMSQETGIRVAGDLTDRQREELRKQQEAGKTAYYRSGRLHFRGQHGSSGHQPPRPARHPNARRPPASDGALQYLPQGAVSHQAVTRDQNDTHLNVLPLHMQPRDHLGHVPENQADDPIVIPDDQPLRADDQPPPAPAPDARPAVRPLPALQPCDASEAPPASSRPASAVLDTPPPEQLDDSQTLLKQPVMDDRQQACSTPQEAPRPAQDQLHDASYLGAACAFTPSPPCQPFPSQMPHTPQCQNSERGDSNLSLISQPLRANGAEAAQTPGLVAGPTTRSKVKAQQNQSVLDSFLCLNPNNVGGQQKNKTVTQQPTPTR